MAPRRAPAMAALDCACRLLVTNRIRLAMALLVVVALLGQPSSGSLALGGVALCAGGMLRIWAAGFLTRDVRLVRQGPYAYCRNPLYLGSAIEWLGVLITAGSAILALLTGLGLAVLYVSTILAEEHALREAFGPAYEEYCLTTPRLWPHRVLRGIRGASPFSWRLVCANHELRNLAAFALAWLGMGAKLLL
jgi:protein-S-isoprenylcysteine O-methyltransferase Ste14